MSGESINDLWLTGQIINYSYSSTSKSMGGGREREKGNWGWGGAVTLVIGHL